MKKQRRFQRIAREWLGTPYQHRQRNKGVGVDCLQFFIAVLAEVGYDMSPVYAYSRSPRPNELLDWIELCDFRPTKNSLVERAKVMDVLVFQTRGIPHHLGLKLTRDTYIHADIRDGIVEEKIEPWLNQKIHSIYRGNSLSKQKDTPPLRRGRMSIKLEDV